MVKTPSTPAASDSSEPDLTQVLAEAVQLVARTSYAEAAERLQAALRDARARGQFVGPRSAELLFYLGLCRYETGALDAAEQCFLAGAAMAGAMDDQQRVGVFLHELSLVSHRRGDSAEAIRRARASLVVKLKQHVADATPANRYAKPRRRREPIESWTRLAWLLLTERQWREAEILYVFARDCYEARNDLGALAKTMIAIATIASMRDVKADARYAISRAVSAATMAGLEVDSLLARHGFAIAPTPSGEPPVVFDMRDRQEVETAVIEQFREIALGLLADRLLREGDLPERTW